MLQWLDLSHNSLTGTIPSSWGSDQAFPSLVYFDVSNTFAHGTLPSFNNKQLVVLDVDTARFTGGLGPFWVSTAPLVAVSLANKSISGSLPQNSSALHMLLVLNLAGNKLQGTVPLSWMQPGQIISHLLLMSLGHVWDASTKGNSWRQDLCLQQTLYSSDVAGEQLKHVQEVVTDLVGLNAFNPLLASSAGTVATFMSGSDQNQLESVKTICANQQVSRLLLIAWLTFAAVIILVLAMYTLLRGWFGKSGETVGWQPAKEVQNVWRTCQVCVKAGQGIIGLGLYYFDLVTSITVLAQVWGKWPGLYLILVFFFHYTMTGAAVAYYSSRQLDTKRGAVRVGLVYTLQTILVAAVCSPLMILIVLLLDTIAFIRAVACAFAVSQSLERLWLRVKDTNGGFKRPLCLSSGHAVGLSWIDMENYENMHNAIAAVFQTIPTIVLNSVIFALGNKPSHGVFISNNLFVRAAIASYLALLKALIVVLWNAYQEDDYVIAYAA